jgi:protein Mpv17
MPIYVEQTADVMSRASHNPTMKLFSTIIVSSCLAAQAFGVTPVVSKSNGLTKPALISKSPLRQKHAVDSPLFRDPTITRGGAIPGLDAYSEALDKNPITTKAMTSLVGWFLGDLLAQVFIAGGPIQWKRLATLSFFGFIYHGPSGHYFYNWLDKQIPGTDAVPVFTKVAVDQIIWCPIFMSVFFTYLGLVNGDSLNTIGNKIKNDLLTACQGSWKVWPIVHLINFKFVPNKWRIPYINAVQIAFNMFLSLLGSKKA